MRFMTFKKTTWSLLCLSLLTHVASLAQTTPAPTPAPPPAPTAEPAPQPPAPAASAAPVDPKTQRIEITGGRASDTEQRRQSTAAKIVIGREEIERYGDSNLLDLM
jgi:outer membrane receptor for ferrienterochelin and colicins